MRFWLGFILVADNSTIVRFITIDLPDCPGSVRSLKATTVAI
jgi:hypothetical protein